MLSTSIPLRPWMARDHRFEIHARPLIMGIVNVTPDSFSDGGVCISVDAAAKHALRLIEDGADILDIGGESSRPGADRVSEAEELRRVIPVVRELSGQVSVPISVDTYKPAVAHQAMEAGASIINDITAMGDPFADPPSARNREMLDVARSFSAGLVLMHMRGTPQTMQADPVYGDVVEELYDFFQDRLQWLSEEGVDLSTVAIDPGIGFGKNDEHNFALLRDTDRFHDLNRPICLGVSRKGFLGRLLNRSLDERGAGSLAVACMAMARGSCHIIRAHDVREARDAAEVYQALTTMPVSG